MASENQGFGLSVVCAQRVIVCIAKINTRIFSPSFLIALPPHSSPAWPPEQKKTRPGNDRRIRGEG
jgi:hypothetical protein